MNLKNIEINKIEYDVNNQPNGVLLLNKPKGITSHDLVDQIRKQYKTRKVGHAGTLDPFAEGLMIVLIGKATKLSDQFLGMDKNYEAEILFGIETNSGDPEGDITSVNPDNFSIKKDELKKTLDSFKPGYSQYVPVFSSVKVQGYKLRELARRSEGFDILEDNQGKKIRFMKNVKQSIILDLPKKDIKLNQLNLISFKEISKEDLLEMNLMENFKNKLNDLNFKTLYLAKVKIECSKGTYIRQLAIDLGEKLEIPAMLINLKRTKIGEFNL